MFLPFHGNCFLFWENKKNIINLSSADFAKRMANISRLVEKRKSLSDCTNCVDLGLRYFEVHCVTILLNAAYKIFTKDKSHCNSKVVEKGRYSCSRGSLVRRKPHRRHERRTRKWNRSGNTVNNSAYICQPVLE